MEKDISNVNNIKKILIMGLDKSGKTSIVLCLKGIKNLMSFYSLNPTRGIKREIFTVFGSEFNVWDFGGQEQFRKDYSIDFKKNIVGTNKIIFVIDIQDTARYSLALQYLVEVVDLLQKSNQNVDFSIFLHKYDPDIDTVNSNFDSKEAEEYIKQIKEALPLNFNYELAKTCIFTIFQKTNIN